MPHNTKPHFEAKRDTRGEKPDRLIVHHPANHDALRAAIERRVAVESWPRRLTLGRYAYSDQNGTYGFVPVANQWVLAALDVDAVRHRICDDLADRLFDKLDAE